MAVLILPLGAGVTAAQEAPVVEISATHSLTGSVDQGDGTYAVTYQVTLTNNSTTDLDTVSLKPMTDKLHSFLSGSSPLDATSLMAGGTVTVAWTAIQLSPADQALAKYPISFYGSATDSVGTVIPVAVISIGGAAQ